MNSAVDTKGFRSVELVIAHGIGMNPKKFVVFDGDLEDSMQPVSESDIEYERISDTETKIKYTGNKRYVSFKP